ncbi:hypothetical protein CBS101457_003251 [Exobasidium rhododendri]|nr:hypothetical protein CBS101457_003251 [Exobasidium rhododendri]
MSKLDTAGQSSTSPTQSSHLGTDEGKKNTSLTMIDSSSSHARPSPAARPSRTMPQSDSLTSLDSPLKDRSLSPYIPQGDSMRDELVSVIMTFQSCDPSDLTSKLHLGSQVHRLLVEGSSDTHIKDDFREAGGFLVIVQMLSTMDQTVGVNHAEGGEKDDQQDDIHERLRVEIYKLALTIIGEAMHMHPKNTHAFQRTVGWSGLASVLLLTNILQTSPERFFAGLLGLALGDVLSNLGRLSAGNAESEESCDEGQIARRIAESWSGSIEHPGAVNTLLTILRDAPITETLHLRILTVLERLAKLNRWNQVAMAKAGTAKVLLTFYNSRAGPTNEDAINRILKRLYLRGISNHDCRTVLRRLNDDISGPYLDFLHGVAGPSSLPNLITFDMTQHSHCSVAMSSLPRPFPPSPASKGFSFFAPVMIEKIEPSLTLDLLHLFDSHRVCSVKLEIEPGTGQITYSSSKDAPPIRFQKSRIIPGRLHHICLTHLRPTGGNKFSLVQLYLDGDFVQEELAVWPATPPKESAMRAVFGTPPLETLQRGRNRLIWSMGPAYLLDDILAPGMPLVISELASTGYCGNFQDSLGRFLTYSISTKINLRLDDLARSNGATEKTLTSHPLVQVITEAARNIFNEDKFYIVLNSANQYDLDRIPKKATSAHSSSVDRTQKIEPQLLLNQAVSLTKDAIGASYGYAKLYGSPVLAPTQSLADTVWKLGGCAILLRFVQLSTSSALLEKSLSFLFVLLQSSWRLSEDVERSKGYEVLNYLLTTKTHLFTPKVVEIFSSAVGYHENQANEAALLNPLLYRTIMLDMNIWAQTSSQVQSAHLSQFIVFLKTSKYRKFNAKRVAKMQIAKKLLQALQLNDYNNSSDKEEFGKKVVDQILSSLRIALISSFNEGAIRSVSTYLTSQLCVPVPSSEASEPSICKRRVPKRQQTVENGAFPTIASSQETRSPLVPQTSSTRIETAIRVFEMVTDLVLERPAFLLKLGSAVNVKWLLIFFGPTSDQRSASLSLEIMTALLLRDKRYADRLARSGGVKVIERLLPKFWNYPKIFSRCWSTLFDIDEQPGNVTLYNQFAPREKQKIMCPLMLRFIVACLGAGFQAAEKSELKKEPRRARPSAFLDIPAKANPRHGRKRSQSMNVDTTELGQAFQVTSELVLLKDNVRLIEEHAQGSIKFCDLLFASPLLGFLVSAITPFVEVQGSLQDSDITLLANRLLNVLANCAVESITRSGNIRAVNATIESIPPDSDVSTATKFRLAFYDRIASSIEEVILPGLGDVLDDQCRIALSDFIEQCSGEVQNKQNLSLIAKLLTSFSTVRPSTTIIATLLTSLDRTILFRIAAGSFETYFEIIEHQEVTFMGANQDLAFFQCLLYNVLSIIHRRVDFPTGVGDQEGIRMACYNVLILLSSARPALVESIILPEKTLSDFREASDVNLAAQLLMGQGESVVPFAAEWQGFTKSRDSLKAAIHLDRMSRVTQSLLSSDQKQKAISNTEKKMKTWQDSVRLSEETKLVKVRLDATESLKFGAGEWNKMLAELQRERAVLGKDADASRIFELDPTEGPMRMRPKLKEMTKAKIEQGSRDDPMDAKMTLMPVSHGDEWASGDITLESVEHDSAGGEVLAAKEDGPAAPTTSREELTTVDTHDDKYRRVIRSLEKGDVIEGVENSLRVLFIECRASLLIFGKKCFYIIDDYFQRPDGELCNLWEAPEEERDTIVMSTLDSEGKGRQSLIEQLEGNAQHTRKWAWSEIKFIALKTFLHRKTAIEIHFKDGRSCLLVLATTDKANNVYRNLADRNKGAAQAFASLSDSLREASSSDGGGFSRLAGAVLGRGIGSITQQWIDQKMSNFDYLMCLNTAAGRTYQDITQYPVMPWVLRDYSSDELDLKDPNTFRDLSLPMGAQEETRRKQFRDRYMQLQELEEIDPDATKPFHYGTHYSTAATVSGYLIRLRPFDKVLKALQGGTFDLADRTFSSLGQAFSSASEGSLGDVRELIPEAYYLPEFLTNSNHFEFGKTQNGVKVDDVELPPWAKGDPRLFIKLHREALECESVSKNLHAWIDLIFGSKQRGDAAIEATNCFHELSYDDGLNLDTLDSSLEQQAVLKTIHMFGVCPRKLFNNPHPCRRRMQDSSEEKFTLLRSPEMLMESIAPIRTLHASVHFIYATDPVRSFASPRDYLILPHLGLSLSIGHLDGSIRFFAKENMNVVRNVVEQVMPDRISAIVDASSHQGNPSDQSESKILVAGRDGNLTAWSVDGPRRSLNFLYSCRGHEDVILCLEYCQAWNMAVSGSQDGRAIIWDNQGTYFKTLKHDAPVQIVSICTTNGLIATASGPVVRLWSINGDLIATVSTSAKDHVTSLAFLEQSTNDSQDGMQSQDTLCMLFTGHRGKVIAWTCVSKISERHGCIQWSLEPRHVFEHHDRLQPATTPLITAIESRQNKLITGDELGRLFLWTLPGQAVELPHNLSTVCMQCDKKFGVFEKRLNCAGCGGLFCNACMHAIGQRFSNLRFCNYCRQKLE